MVCMYYREDLTIDIDFSDRNDVFIRGQIRRLMCCHPADLDDCCRCGFQFHRHTIAYDDGEVASLKLWQHSERIRVLNDPSEWSLEAERSEARFRDLKCDKGRKSVAPQEREGRAITAAASLPSLDDASPTEAAVIPTPRPQRERPTDGVVTVNVQDAITPSPTAQFVPCRKGQHCNKSHGHVARCNTKLLLDQSVVSMIPRGRVSVQFPEGLSATLREPERVSAGAVPSHLLSDHRMTLQSASQGGRKRSHPPSPLSTIPSFDRCKKGPYCSKRAGHVARCNKKLMEERGERSPPRAPLEEVGHPFLAQEKMLKLRETPESLGNMFRARGRKSRRLECGAHEIEDPVTGQVC